MDDITKMFHTLVNGQSALKQELLHEISKLRKEMNDRFDKLNDKIEKVDKKVEKNGKRIDKLVYN